MFRRRIRARAAVAELWRSRALIRTLAERDLRARYKQTVIGFAWAVITPVTLMVVFSVFFRRVADIDTYGAPYALFAYLGLLPWTFFSSSVSQGGTSLMTNMPLLNKVYCPREVFPLASVGVAAIDTVTAAGVLGILFAINGYVPRGTTIWVPLILIVQVTFTLGVVFVLSSLMVYVRDLRQALPIVLQLGLFATPVAYGLDQIPPRARPFYAAVNPLASVVDGYRRTILYGQRPTWTLLGISAAFSTAIFVGGYLMFKRLETGIADVA